MSAKREKIADWRRFVKWLIADMESTLGVNEALPHTMPLMERLNALDKLDTELAVKGEAV